MFFKFEPPLGQVDEKGFDTSLADVPEGVLPDVIKLLKELISEDTDKAFEYIESDPLAAVAVTTILREQKDSEDEMFLAFRKEYYKRIDNLFSLEKLSSEIGMGFVVELILGKWRQLTQSLDFDSTIDQLLFNLNILKEKVDELIPNPSNRVIFEMVDDSIRRLEGFQSYEHDRAEKILPKIRPHLESAIQNTIKEESSLSKGLEPWLALASMKHQMALELRNNIRDICLDIIKGDFENLPEDDKFKLAPYLMYLDKDKEATSDSTTS